ncbi:MAG: hypothetical protein AAGI46_00520 [Planctomycetota bacterium]
MAGSASACPTCRDSVATPTDAQAVAAQEQAAGFNLAIWTMLSVAVVAAGTVSLTVFRSDPSSRAQPRDHV